MMAAMPATLLAMLTMLAMAPADRAAQEPPSPGPGVSETLARERAARLSDIQYELSFEIPAERAATITGRETLRFTLSDAATPLAIDFAPGRDNAIHSVETEAGRVDARQVDGHLLIPASALREGANRLSIAFDAGDAPLNRNDEYLYTIFVPARAHEVFPCFDQPDLKAEWTLTLDVPEHWEPLANGAEPPRERHGARERIGFARTKPISTYLFAFAAGRFSVERAERDGRTFRMFHRETDAQKVARNRDAIFDLHAAAIAWLERYTGIPYPFGKFDFLLVPSFQFGGMEHPGAIFYNASGLFLDESATQNQELARASVISHETSHIWFGGLVTMRWFTDVWMKEVFANFMAAKIVNPSFPRINHALRFLLAYYPSAYDVDRTAGTNAIRQPLANLNEAGTLYGAIIYQKAPIVMRQLEMLVGEEPFRDGLREYLRRYSFGNASWSDLIALLDAKTPEDLAAWSRAWVEEAGRPVIRTELETSGPTIQRLAFVQRDADADRGLVWNEQLEVALGYADGIRKLPVHLDSPTIDVPAARGLPVPRYVLPNGGGIGYGEFHLDPASREWITHHLPEIPDALTRGSAWVTLWDAMLDGEVRPEDVVSLALRALPQERDELNTQQILDYLAHAYWTYLPAAARSSLAPDVEGVLRRGLADASTTSLKSAYFSTLRDVALTPPTLGWLSSVWTRQETVPGLTLSETDDIQLAEQLAVREVPNWERIVEEQLVRTKNPDRKARFAFVRPALSADPAARDAWFESLRDPANRRHEAWVLDGLRFLHHPLRAARAVRYIQPSLDLLQAIQRTGDIFFPKRWMDATLGGHRSREAAEIVRAFLGKLPAAYPDRLRRIILSSADDLFRASRMP
jgi:aminopeptidase N